MPQRSNYRTDAAAAPGEQMSSAAPTTELGAAGMFGATPWSSMWQGDPLEQVGELQFPQSAYTYADMLNDSQLEGLHLGSTLPIMRYRWYVNPNGAKVERARTLAGDLGVPVLGEGDVPRGRSRDRFSHLRHLEGALRALYMGFYPFEVVGTVKDDGLWHLTRLGARPPATIMDIDLTPQGDLRSVRQNITQLGQAVQPIPAERLVWYAWAQEGANVTGRSMFRSVYKNWLIKDRLLRVDAVKHERNGMGVPVIEAFPGAGKVDMQQLNSLAQRYKAGDTSGGALPNGAKLTLQGVIGSLPDTLASIRYHDEAMARRFLLMYMQLGQTHTGSRALGDSFLEFFLLAQEAIANWYRDTTNEQLIERYWDWNYGEDEEQVPVLEWARDEDPELAVADLVQAIDSGLVRVDDELEDATRHAMKLPSFKGPVRALPKPPAPDSSQAPPSTAPDGTAAAGGDRAVRGAVGSSLPESSLPDRPLRRQPADYEVKAQVDLRTIDDTWQAALDHVFEDWRSTVTQAQINELQDAVSATSSLKELATLEATPSGQAILVQAMASVYEAGVAQAKAEAERQGVDVTSLGEVDVASAVASFENRAGAIDEMAARGLANMASSKAVSLSGGGLSQTEVGAEVGTYLGSLTHSMLRDRLAGAVTTAMNDGRRAFMREAPAATYYSSEILDANTCMPCTGVDGTAYGSVSDTERDYPGGGYVNCAGGDRCRGSIVAVYAEDSTS